MKLPMPYAMPAIRIAGPYLVKKLLTAIYFFYCQKSYVLGAVSDNFQKRFIGDANIFL